MNRQVNRDQAPIGLFYESSTCYTEMVSEKIADELNTAFGDTLVQANPKRV